MLFGNCQRLLTPHPTAETAERKKSLNVLGVMPTFLVFFVSSSLSPLVGTKSELWDNVSCQNEKEAI